MELYSCKVTEFDGIFLSFVSSVPNCCCQRRALFMCCHAKKLRQFSLWLQEVMEIRGASAAESAPDPPPPPPRLLFPLSQEPNTGPGHRDRAGECQESSQHICSLLCTFSPLWGCKERRRFQGKSPRSESGRTKVVCLMGKRRATGE